MRREKCKSRDKKRRKCGLDAKHPGDHMATVAYGFAVVWKRRFGRWS